MIDTPPVTLSIVIPAFNEAPNLPTLVQEIQHVLPEAVSFEILFIDDASSDDTWQIIEQQSSTTHFVRGFKLSRNFGKEAAMRLGLEQASGAAVVVMDADLQHPPALLNEMFTMWQSGRAEVIEAIKKDRGSETALYKFCSLAFYHLFSRLTGMNLKGSSDFKLLDRRVVDSLLQLEERATFFRGMTQWVGYTHLQIPFEVAERSDGRSGWSTIKLAKFFVRSIISFTSVPLLIVSFFGFIFLAIAGLLILQTLLNYLGGNAVEGFTTVIIVQLIIGSCILVGLGTVGLYIAVMFEEIKGRPKYFVEKTTGSISDRQTE